MKKIDNAKYLKSEAKRLAAFLKTHPKSATNAVFLEDMIEILADTCAMQLRQATWQVIADRKAGKDLTESLNDLEKASDNYKRIKK